MAATVVLIPLLVAGLLAAAVRAGTAPPPATGRNLTAVRRTTARWRWAGVAVGVAGAAMAIAAGDALGRGLLLAAPIAAIGILAGVIAGEVRVTAPAPAERAAELRPRRLRDYLPRWLATAVGIAIVLFAVVTTVTTAVGSPDDLGRAGRTLVRACSPAVTVSSGPWPGSFYTLPAAAAVLIGAAGAAIALRLVLHRPRQGEARQLDDALRRDAVGAVVAATGLLVALPLAGISLFASAAMASIECVPGWWQPVTLGLLGLSAAMLALCGACGMLLLAPGGRRHSASTPVRVGR